MNPKQISNLMEDAGKGGGASVFVLRPAGETITAQKHLDHWFGWMADWEARPGVTDAHLSTLRDNLRKMKERYKVERRISVDIWVSINPKVIMVGKGPGVYEYRHKHPNKLSYPNIREVRVDPDVMKTYARFRPLREMAIKWEISKNMSSPETSEEDDVEAADVDVFDVDVYGEYKCVDYEADPLDNPEFHEYLKNESPEDYEIVIGRKKFVGLYITKDYYYDVWTFNPENIIEIIPPVNQAMSQDFIPRGSYRVARRPV